MRLFSFFLVGTLLIMAGCAYAPPKPIAVSVPTKKVDYLADIKPILDKRCVSCHSCYNSPCQAKFSSFDGVDRGGSKEKVYLPERFFPQKPTRLFVDARNTGQWREKGFFSLTENRVDEKSDASLEAKSDTSKKIIMHNSIMAQMLYDKKQNPEIIGEYAPETDELVCAKNLEEVAQYQDQHPNHGMPYGFPALPSDEYDLIIQWLAQGAQGPSDQQQVALEAPSLKASNEIQKWEAFLNRDDAKHKMTARYLYEHYFLAHINFKNDPREFFRLVRSTTPPGQKIDPLGTLRPYDDPKTDKFYYRFEKVYSTIVHKTHMPVEFDDEELSRIKSLFIDVRWAKKPYVVGYDKKQSANPFLTFAQIPASSRYAFMLDHNHYFVQTFIKGPVCKGQIALNVIHDHFWVMFQEPKYDLGVMHPEFLLEQAENLSMPIETGSYEKIYRVFSDRYRERYEKYYEAKVKKTAEVASKGWSIDGIWKGGHAGDTPALTVYRHFDSASVQKGVVGELPRTMWVIDYAHFERLYYALVAGYDVFGNISHQTNIRRYMDFLRLEGEINFLLYMPQSKRKAMFASWYLGDAIADDVNKDKDNAAVIGNSIIYKTEDPKQEFIERLVDEHFIKEADVRFDKINYFRAGESSPRLPQVYKTKEDYLQGLRALTAPGTGFIRHVVDEGVNLGLVRIRLKNEEEISASFIVNRWHDNVNALFGEANRLDSSKDTLDIVNGSVGSYPNMFFDVKEEDLPDFFDMLMNFEENDRYAQKIKKYAISRSDKNFWEYFDWFQKEFDTSEPLDSGLYDLNRYYRKPL